MDPKSINVTIDGKEVEALPGQTILDVARAQGIFIPTLCYLECTTKVGACRVCVVELEGARSLVASCTMPVSPGMVVKTNTKKVRDAQRLVVELLWSAGDHNCLTCNANGQCELQNLVYWLQIDKPRFKTDAPGYPIEVNNSMISRDLNKCILCGRCVRACNEIQVNEVLDFMERGSNAKVGPAFDADYINSNCVFCGQCLDACPTGAISFKDERFKSRPWETQKVKTTCTYCGVGCQLDLNIHHGKIVKVTANKESKEPSGGCLCVKGRFGLDFVDHPDRLKKPLIRREKGGELEEANWDEALGFIAKKFKSIKKKYGGDALAGLASARCTNEENYLFQKFMRAALHTNNVDHCARL